MFLIGVLAQAAVAAAPQTAAAPAQGVISYPAEFFANYQPGNASEMVQRVPGFSLDSGNSVRGFEGAAGNVLIDGQRPTSKTDSLDEILRRIPASRVERIDVIRGGAPGIDMQGKTVLANIIRKKGGGTRILFAAAQNHTWDGRTAPAMRFEGNGSVGERKWEFGSFWGKGIDDGSGDGPGVHVYADGRPSELRRIDSTGDGMNGFATAAGESPLAGGKLRLNGRIAFNKFKYEEDDFIYAPKAGLQTEDDADKTHDTEIGANYSRALGARTALDVVALRQTHPRDLSAVFVDNGPVNDFVLGRESTETIGRAVLKYRYSDRISMEGGGEYALNTLDSRTGFSVDGDAQDIPAANVQVEERRNEIFLKGTWRASDRWTVDGGLRYESSTISSEGDVVLEKTLHYAKPRLAITWAPSATRQVRLRIEREVGQLNFNDFVASASLNTATGVTAGNPDLNPEQAWVLEAAFEQRFWRSGVVVLTARHSKLTDAIDRGPVAIVKTDPVTGQPILDAGTGQPVVDIFDQPTNIGDGTKDELTLEVTLPLDKLGWRGGQLKGDVTKRWSEVTDPTTHETREISGLHPLDFNVSFIHDMPARHLSWGVDAYGAWRQTYYRFNTIETVKLHTYLRPFIEWRPRPDINIRAEIPNATARDLRRTVKIYPHARNLPGQPDIEDRLSNPGRMFYVRVRKTFGG
jgi:outer membrane receptor protein involved in Fe transport